ncbi:MAG: hypothetical protein WC455_11010 [Dehalococcoidia bacterium]|jgi:hypothetical protein
METETLMQSIARVTGLYRGTFNGLLLLTPDTPLSPEEVSRNPIFYQLDLNPDKADENLIIDLIYDNLAPIRLNDMRRGTDMPHGVRFWMDWFDIPHYDEMHDIDGRVVYPRAPGVHRVRIRTGRRKWAQMGRVRDFSPENGGSTSPAFLFKIAE